MELSGLGIVMKQAQAIIPTLRNYGNRTVYRSRKPSLDQTNVTAVTERFCYWSKEGRLFYWLRASRAITLDMGATSK